MGMNESDRSRQYRLVLTENLANRLNEYAVVLEGKTPVKSLIEYDPKPGERLDRATQEWFKALSTLRFEERGQVVRTLTALERAGVHTVEELRDIPILSRKHMPWAHDIGEVRLAFIKQLFPVPQANPTR
ncbi:MAG: hypothetical protein NTY06_01815 [Candidatus Gottesmanbacteria bacterium]|nr:hypothetical protein [Candidatus Gottesmanbacteria bacterium]